MRRTTRSHVIFGMNLKESDVGLGLKNGAIVFGLEADTSSQQLTLPLDRNLLVQHAPDSRRVVFYAQTHFEVRWGHSIEGYFITSVHVVWVWC